MAYYHLTQIPAEVKVGEFLEVVLDAPSSRRTDDWVGIYPRSIPSVPGVSCGRWMHVPPPPPCTSESGPAPGSQRVTLQFPPEKLPNHPGQFEVRVHSGKYNSYKVLARASLTVVQSPVSKVKRMLFLGILVGIVAFFQHLLNAKGVCSYQDPTIPDMFDDLFVSLTSPINSFWVSRPDLAQLTQAISSFVLDGTLLLLLSLGAFRRSTIRPFLALFVFMALRFIAQSIATFPCPPGFIWPVGAIMGVPIPTLFVDYHPANDFFFRYETFLVSCEFFF